jgi:hypothetical protein
VHARVNGVVAVVTVAAHFRVTVTVVIKDIGPFIDNAITVFIDAIR